MNYIEYIASADWKEKRLKRIEIDGYECRLCGSRETLEVHHKPGSYKNIPNESIENDLTTLCKRCHDMVTNVIRADRYGTWVLPEVEMIANNIETRKENYYGLAGIELQVDIIDPTDHAQWTDGRPGEQVVYFEKTDYIERN